MARVSQAQESIGVRSVGAAIAAPFIFLQSSFYIKLSAVSCDCLAIERNVPCGISFLLAGTMTVSVFPSVIFRYFI